MQQESQQLTKNILYKNLKKEITYIKRSNYEVMLKLRKYVDYEEYSLNRIDSNYLEIMKLNFTNSTPGKKDSLNISAFKIKSTNKNEYLKTENHNNIILAESTSQTIVSNNDMVQTIILILQGFSPELGLTKSEIDNAYKAYFESLL